MKTAAEVLLIDDNPADIDLMRETLAQSKRKFQVTAVSNGTEALSCLRRRHGEGTPPGFDLVILDLNLPCKNGREVLAEVKTDPSLRHLPVIIFTTSEAPVDVRRSYELGANCYLRKPGNLPDFIALLELMEKFWFDCVILPSKEKS